jgi:hypothetical protein
LLLREIPEWVQRQLGVGASEPVTFVQLSARAYEYRDAIRFKNGRELLLQRLPEGQQVDVLGLSSGDFDEAEHQRLEEEHRAFLQDETPQTTYTAATTRRIRE